MMNSILLLIRASFPCYGFFQCYGLSKMMIPALLIRVSCSSQNEDKTLLELVSACFCDGMLAVLECRRRRRDVVEGGPWQ
jgi:hypothetical protein